MSKRLRRLLLLQTRRTGAAARAISGIAVSWRPAAFWLNEREKRRKRRKTKKSIRRRSVTVFKTSRSLWEARSNSASPFRMSTRDLFFDAVDISVIKAEPRVEYPGGGAQQTRTRGEEREGDDGVIGSTGQHPLRPPQTPAQAALATADVADPSAPPPAPPPPRPPPPPPAYTANPITASELRLAASAALRLAVEAIDALHGLKEVAIELAADVRELLEATRRAGGRGGGSRRRGRRSASTSARWSSGGGLGVRTRAQARRRR